jgi:hypothetical protein
MSTIEIQFVQNSVLLLTDFGFVSLRAFHALIKMASFRYENPQQMCFFSFIICLSVSLTNPSLFLSGLESFPCP